MSHDSAFVLVTRLGHEVGGMLARLDIDLIGKETQKTIVAIRRLAADARLDVRDYEMSDTKAEMLENAVVATKRLEELRSHILNASEHGIFGAIDVTQLSVELDAIVAELR